MKVELHILQNFPPHNLNRDDTGAPKDTEFGGYRRGRISSQCLKRSIRWSEAFRTEAGDRLAVRTKRAAGEIARILVEEGGKPIELANAAARAAIAKLVSATDGEGRTSVLFYIGSDELRRVADGLTQVWEEVAPAFAEIPAVSEIESEPKKKAKGKKGAKADDSKLDKVIAPVVKDYLDTYTDKVGSIDIALFGRMLAENPKLNIDASCQVAHAISTNRVSMEFDYFTAVDDLMGPNETGAGMIGTVGFNSSCFYRYAVIDADQLAFNLGGNIGSNGAKDPALDGIRAFIRGSIAAIPSGKQNSFAAHTPPSLVMAVVRPDGSQPVSLANAFEVPVQPRGNLGLISASVKSLDRHWKSLTHMYGTGSARPFVVVNDDTNELDSLKSSRCTNVDELVERTLATVNEGWSSRSKV